MTDITTIIARALNKTALTWEMLHKSDRKTLVRDAGAVRRELERAGYAIVPIEPTEVMDNFCATCRHKYEGPADAGLTPMLFITSKCARPIGGTNPVTGRKWSLGKDCSDERSKGWLRDRCGPEGKYWEQG